MPNASGEDKPKKKWFALPTFYLSEKFWYKKLWRELARKNTFGGLQFWPCLLCWCRPKNSPMWPNLTAELRVPMSRVIVGNGNINTTTSSPKFLFVDSIEIRNYITWIIIRIYFHYNALQGQIFKIRGKFRKRESERGDGDRLWSVDAVFGHGEDALHWFIHCVAHIN